MSESTNPAEPATSAVPEPVLPPRRIVLLAVLAAVIVVFDLITKLIAVAFLTEGQEVRLLGGVLNFYLIRNPGAAFGMADSMTWLLSLIVIAVIVAIIRMAKRLRSSAWAVSLGLILGGAVGNLIDRIFRSPGFLRGHVVDFVSLFEPRGQHFAIFNVADSAITIGGILLVITALRGIEVDGSKVPSRSKKADEANAPVSAEAESTAAGSGPEPADLTKPTDNTDSADSVATNDKDGEPRG